MKPTIPQGTRDFDAATVRKRQYIFDTIRSVFELYGYEPLETPAMENMDTLLGKYGEEGDKLIFKILNNGLDHPAKAEKVQEGFKKITEGKNSTYITERALRYDLTIPFARYVAMNYQRLTMPYKRYQIQPVWRADRPQKGRYREFYQCDADVVGSTSLMNELELANIYATVFEQLKIPVEIRINNRKILAALAAQCGEPEKLTDITTAIDKLEKIGAEKIKEELQLRGLSDLQIAQVETYIRISGSNEEKLAALKQIFTGNEIGQQGLAELEFIFRSLPPAVHQSAFVLDPTLARGLNYYTGTIFEVKASTAPIGSIGGGGRYDNLTGLFGVPGVPGVGISFGVDRIYDVLSALHLFPAHFSSATKLLFFNLGLKESAKALELASRLRREHISCEVYHENSKFDKQFRYAEKKSIPFVAILGSKELEQGVVTLKNLATGTQQQIPFDQLTKINL